VTPIGPNTAFVLTIFGLLGIYGELVWPGCRVARIIGPGVLGLGAVLVGGYFLWLHSPSTLGITFLGAAAALFAVEAVVNTYFVAGAAGTAAMAIGFWKLYDNSPGIGSRGINAVLVFPLCVAFGVATIVLSHGAKRARQNKRTDIS
jgi:membrane-bound ClpP family serine protease